MEPTPDVVNRFLRELETAAKRGMGGGRGNNGGGVVAGGLGGDEEDNSRDPDSHRLDPIKILGWMDRHVLAEEARGVQTPERTTKILALCDALTLFSRSHPRQCQLVAMRFFRGMVEEEIAEELGVHVRTVTRDLGFARAWLFYQLTH